MLQIITFSYKVAAVLFHTKADTPVEGIKNLTKPQSKDVPETTPLIAGCFAFFFAAKNVNVMLSSEVTAKLTGQCLDACASAFQITYVPLFYILSLLFLICALKPRPDL